MANQSERTNLGKTLPSQEELNHLFLYSPETGELKWKLRPDQSSTWNSRYANKIAGYKRGDYIIISINKIDYKAHRLIWVLQTGENIDNTLIDHKDNNGYNNSWLNLRKASSSQNSMNRCTKNGDMKNIEKLASGKYRVRIHANGKRYSSKSISLEEAITWRNEKLEELHKEFANYVR